MTDTNEILLRARRANPVPDIGQIATDDLLAVRLSVESRRGPDRPRRQRARPRRLRGHFAVAAAAFVAVILLIGAVALLPWSPADVVDQQPPTTTESTTTAAPSTATTVPTDGTETGPIVTDQAKEASSFEMLRLTHNTEFEAPSAAAAGVSMTDVAHGNGIWVAVGETSAVLGADNAFVDRVAIWMSSDATSWERLGGHRDVEYGEGPWQDGGPTMVAVTATASGFVAVGSDVDLDAASGQPRGAVWQSPDGRNWNRVDNLSGVFGEGDFWVSIHDVVADGDHVVAVGEFGDAAAVWRSTDGGTEWTRIEHDEDTFGLATTSDDAHDGAGDGRQAMLAVTFSEEGFIAVGTSGGSPHAPDGGAGTDSSGIVWQSPDGTVWRRVTTSGDPFEGLGRPVPGEVLTFADQYFVVGFDRSADPDQPANVAAVWRSEDLAGWTRVDDPAFTDLGESAIHGAAKDGSRVVLVGRRLVGDTSIATVWVSSDGRSWAMRDAGLAQPGTFLAGVGFGDDGVVLVGAESRSGDWYDTHAAVWRIVDS